MGTVIILIIVFLLIRGAIDYYKSEHEADTEETRKILYAEQIATDIGTAFASANRLKFLQYFAQLEEVSKRYRENELVARKMEGNVVIIKDRVFSISGQEDEPYIFIGKESIGRYERCICTLIGSSKDRAKELKAGDTVMVIGVLQHNDFGYLRLNSAQIMYLNGDYVPGVKQDMQKLYGDVELTIY